MPHLAVTPVNELSSFLFIFSESLEDSCFVELVQIDKSYRYVSNDGTPVKFEFPFSELTQITLEQYQ